MEPIHQIPPVLVSLKLIAYNVLHCGRIAVANEKGLALVNIDPENKEDEDVESTDMESTGVVTGFDKFPSQLMEETIYKVKSARTLDFHPTKPWMVVTQADRFVHIWDYRAKGLKWPIEINGAKVTLAKFLAHQQWVMAGTTGGSIHVYDCDSKEQKRVLHKHTKPIKSLAIHGTESLVLSASMDGKILLWDYAGEDWNLRKTFDVKSQCLMQVAFDPKDTNMFASAQDKTVKIWDRCQDDSQLTTILTGHSYQIECLDYFSGGGDKPYMITGSRDKTAKIWDCKNASCVQTLEGHAGPVDIVCCHSGVVSILITGCREDGSIRLWNSTDFR
ncbi:putative coatomer subunit beta'-3 [Panicum virgatum]|uniref:putative coatomer subunit beta'-3 n=1 Tax=Panicum virgatum TaxID=38727 RepID=UPI0019D5C2AA|nr:putative coatomer subunit beta'-3 [Panicum virgatum]